MVVFLILLIFNKPIFQNRPWCVGTQIYNNNLYKQEEMDIFNEELDTFKE